MCGQCLVILNAQVCVDPAHKLCVDPAHKVQSNTLTYWSLNSPSLFVIQGLSVNAVSDGQITKTE